MNFRKLIKPFLTNKGFITNSNIALKVGNEIITTDKKLSETFNNHYINIIEKVTGSKPDTNLDKFSNVDTRSAISKIKELYANHPSIIEIKKTKTDETIFSFKEVEGYESCWYENFILKKIHAEIH